MLLTSAALLAGCARDLPLATDGGRAGPEGPSMQLNPACSGSGGLTHAGGTITTTERWYPADNPHQVTGMVTVGAGGQLRIQPGALVCFSSGAGVRAVNGGTLAVDGLDTAIVVLTALDLAQGWGGIVLSDTPGTASFIHNARVEHAAGVAVLSEDRHLLVMDSVHLRQNGAAVHLFSPQSRLLRSVVDTTTAPWAGAVALGDSTRFNHTTIRGAVNYGLVVLATSGVVLGSGRIEGSGGVGLYAGDGIATAQPIRVVGGAAHGAELSIGALAELYPGAAAQDSLLGNARDTLYLLGGTLSTTVYAQANLPWHVTLPVTVSSGGIFRASPGAHLAMQLNAGIQAKSGGRLWFRGAPGTPVVLTATDTADRWSGIYLDGLPSSTSYLTNALIEHTSDYASAVAAMSDHRVVIDSTVIRQVGYGVSIWSDGSRISRSRIDTTRVAGAPAVDLVSDAVLESTLIRGSAGAGLEIWGPARIRSCEIRESAGDGIVMFWAVEVDNCNLVDNAGVGIANQVGSTADVTNNWWGDAAGPTGTSGDGASGPLTVSPWRTTPYVLPYVP